ncbi:hypothetical protein K438DRAFT_669353 [Mycena galopus ATCC 62051]|nr:hypothetical protein K438DRAFT_669353 [Mycena galopus ATCC 62051]
MKIEVALCNAFEATSDLLASITLSYEFYKNKGSINLTNSILDKLLGFAVARGVLVTVAQLLTLALYVAQPTKLNWMPVHFSQGKLCHITMITILNLRGSLRRPNRAFINDSMVNDSVIRAFAVSHQINWWQIFPQPNIIIEGRQSHYLELPMGA